MLLRRSTGPSYRGDFGPYILAAHCYYTICMEEEKKMKSQYTSYLELTRKGGIRISLFRHQKDPGRLSPAKKVLKTPFYPEETSNVVGCASQKGHVLIAVRIRKKRARIPSFPGSNTPAKVVKPHFFLFQSHFLVRVGLRS